MKNKISNIIFIVLFMAILILPAVFINTKTQQISLIDNVILTEWPGMDIRLSTIEDIESYVNTRIGFREQIISAYTYLNDKLFHVMVHPLFMYGKEGHIFFKDPAYIKAYQRLNTDEEWLDSFSRYLERTKAYLDGKDIRFLYYLCPDKKTVYSEYFPESIYVNEDNTPVIEYLEGDLEKTDIDYIIPDDELKEAKSTQVVYNKLYDATHWNEDGAFIGHELLDEKIQEYFDDVAPLSRDDYDRTMETEDSLDVSRFPINEQVPLYTLKEDKSQNFTDLLLTSLEFENPSFYCHFVNPECENNKILLVFTDSYFKGYYKFYQNRFREVYFVHRQNYRNLQYYVNLFFPDMVVFETAERSISGEMMELIEQGFDDVTYEPAYDGNGEFKKKASLRYMLSEVKGLRYTGDDNRLLLNVNGGDQIVSIRGFLVDDDYDGQSYDIYARIGGETIIEGEYDTLSDPTRSSSMTEFCLNIQRRYLIEEDIELIAVDRETKEEYLVEDFEVRYEQ
ncbi:MAG: hypothetical protein K6B28_11295 [Lachnospiraceae bacterium]|nr:hypothetical protein [Lachnospiraceae bacterium]